MSRFNHVVQLFEAMDAVALETLKEFETILKTQKLSLLDAVERDLERCKATGVLTFDVNNIELDEPDYRRTETGSKHEDTTTSSRCSLKENIPENNTTSVRSSTRPKRNAFAETTQMSNIPSNITKTMNVSVNNLISNITVKMERLSEKLTESQADILNCKLGDLDVKKEISEMPPPLRPPIKQTRGRKKGAAAKNANLEALNVKIEQIDEEEKKRIGESEPLNKQPSATRDSDVQIQCEPIHTISLVDSEEEEKPKTRGRARTKKMQNKEQTSNSEQDNENVAQTTTRSTRTKTRNAAAKNKIVESDAVELTEKQKRMRSPSTEDDVKNKKGTTANSKRTRAEKALENKQVEDNNNTSVYEDAVSNAGIHKNNDENIEEVSSIGKGKKAAPYVNGLTGVAKTAALNETLVLDKPKNAKLNEIVVKEKRNNMNLNDLMTDDEDVIASPTKDKKPKVKQVFSPYASSPVKQRVQAYEKLRTEANSDLPPRMTRTKTKAKAQENNEDNSDQTQSNNVNFIKQGAVPKVRSPPTKKGSIPVLRTTPVSDNRILTYPHTTDKMKQKAYANQSSSDNTSVAKPRSAIKSSQAEFRERELRRKQKEAEALSKKEAIIQALTEERRRKREERQLKAQQTRDAIEKDKQKVLESAERIKQEKTKQMLAEKEDKLLKQREEASRKRALAQKKAAEEKQNRLEQEKMQNKNNIPPYLKYEAPMLPTDDCYDSDDSSCGKPKSTPAWQKKELTLKILKSMRYLEVKKRSFFCNGPTTVNLREVFPSIEAHKLKRTSSAIWNRSGMLRLAALSEEGEAA